MIVIFFKKLCNRVRKRTAKFNALGTAITLEIFSSKNIFEKAVGQVINEVAEIEEMMSIKNPDSEISKINKYAGQRKITVSSDTLYVIKTADLINKKTGGAFDIRIGPLSQVYSVFKNTHIVPDKKVIDVSLKNSGSGEIDIDEKNKTVYLTGSKMSIDLGAIYKGFAVDKIERILKGYHITDALIKVGENIKSIKSNSKKPNTLNIKSHQISKNNVLGTLNINNGAVFISERISDITQNIDFNSKLVIDPKTGMQTNSSLESVTVVCENAMIAEALSTALLVMGEVNSKDILSYFDAQALFVKNNLDIYCSESIKSDFKAN